MMTKSLISLNGLGKSFPMAGSRFVALEDINLSFGEGEFTGIVGPSGSGKTTMLNIIGSLDNPTKGEALVLGKSVGNLNAKESARLRKQNIGFIFQSYNLLPFYTVYENVEFPLLLLKMSVAKRKKAVLEAIDAVGLTPKIDSKPKQLSGGECQRVAIARAMVKKPSLVLADEPTANLDAENSHHILKTMLKLNESMNTTFIFATHDEKVIQYLKRKISLEDGHVAKDETIKQ